MTRPLSALDGEGPKKRKRTVSVKRFKISKDGTKTLISTTPVRSKSKSILGDQSTFNVTDIKLSNQASRNNNKARHSSM
jgi:hypothetical protein